MGCVMTDIRKLLDEATPGPWDADGDPWNRIVWSFAENRVCFIAHSNGANDQRDIATSDLIALAPQLAEALLVAMDGLKGVSQQKRTDELATEHDVEVADFEGGCDDCINCARSALAAVNKIMRE